MVVFVDEDTVVAITTRVDMNRFGDHVISTSDKEQSGIVTCTVVFMIRCHSSRGKPAPPAWRRDVKMA